MSNPYVLGETEVKQLFISVISSPAMMVHFSALVVLAIERCSLV
jgi:hypothetical protein